MHKKTYDTHTFLVFFCIWLLLLHLGGLFLFTRGFLLSRLVLNNKSQCSETPFWNSTDNQYETTEELRLGSCWYPTQFKKVVIIIIDALRFDFAASHSSNTNLDFDHSHYLNKLPIFHELIKSQPYNSLLFQYIADAPTTTLQRLKALTTGTLPTFIDAGSNFAGSSINEDNLIDQLSKQGKKIAFMGDDTWVSLFPDQLETNMTHAFPSFNVWDLHTVDEGILNLLVPTIKKERYRKGSSFSGTDWDVLIAHFLGVDHCGHRYGPDHPAMSDKLNQMNKMIQNVVNSVDEDTIVLVMGDHGMDPKGDHGGDSDNEVESALFVYSKKQLTIDEGIMAVLHRILQKVDDNDLYGQKSFTTDFGKWRRIPQIDFVPTLSLLLGLPIPFNSLGSVIPELFLLNSKDENYHSSIEQKLLNLLNVISLNTRQVYQYIIEYSRQQPSSELSEEAHHFLGDLFEQAENQYNILKKSSRVSLDDLENLIVKYISFLRITLSICRRIWAQFDLPLMISGISILLASCVIMLFHLFADNQMSVLYVLIGGIVGAAFAISSLTRFLLEPFLSDSNFSTLDFIILSASIGSVFSYLIWFIKKHFYSFAPFHLYNHYFSFDSFLAILFLVLHTLIFASNSYTVFEDRISVGLLQTFGIYMFIKAFSTKYKRSRMKLLIFTFISLVAIRIAAYSTICREEQMPYCVMTFYASSANSLSSPVVLLFLVVFSLLIPFIIRKIIFTKDFDGIAPIWIFWIDWALRAGLILSAIYWIMDNRITSPSEDTLYSSNLITDQGFKWAKNFLVRMAFGIVIFGNIIWWKNPLCIDNPRESSNDVEARQFSEKIYGPSYFIFLTIVYLLLVITQKPMGGLMLSVALYQIMSLLKIFDIKRDASQEKDTSFLETIIFSLCGTLFFFSTGHQATISSIQWSVGFIGIDEANFTITPILITLNTLSSQILFTCAIPLLVFWNRSSNNLIYYSLTKTIIYYNLYNSIITTSTAIWAAWFRRHLMVWKIFAPRFMLGGINLLCIDFVIFFIVVSYACTKVIKRGVGKVSNTECEQKLEKIK
ncbi:unnamed protein product [Rhizophagus irregularis]|uniref:Alkaline phosphatase-like protein n=1 Tax=Rhizophagus irregularis TaxID=588596 RepID=A0A2I1GJA3_9GLOM|nr:alkaline phosphatase-like protein [Rhizophagus irregularis]CAB4413534.1 unnamed protein product [Rhizophagus irregularis]